jgi:predicted phage tail protein
LRVTSGGAVVFDQNVGGLTSVSGTAPVGTYQADVFAVNAAGQSAATTRSFTVGGGCAPPPAPTFLSGGIFGGTATVTWQPSAGATTYIVQAGTVPGSANLFNANVGATTSVSASGLPAGFRAFVRVIAVNACGQQSAPSADFLLQ